MARCPFSLSCHARDVFVQHSLLKFLASRTDRIVVCNTAAQTELLSITATMSTQTSLIRHPLPEVGSHLAYSPSPLSFLAVGRPVAKKDYATLLSAFAMVQNHYPDAELQIAGATADEIGGTRRGVVAHGLVPFITVAQLMLRSSAVVHASCVAADGDRDGLPNAIVEAMLLGVPVIASDAGSIGDLVIQRVTGRLVPKKDPNALAQAILHHIEHPEDAMAMAHAARQQVLEQHSTAVTVDRLEAFLFSSGV
jgi:glycosyltransferase involved in cell wall biosynthesis